MSNYGLQQLFEESVSAVTATNSVQLGTERWQDGKRYQYMYNKDTEAAVGKIVGLVGSGACAVSSPYSFTVDTVAGSSDCVGVIEHTAIPASYYGWVLKEGMITFDTVTSAMTAGYGIGVGDAGAVDTSSNTTNIIIGVSVDSVSTAGCSGVGVIKV